MFQGENREQSQTYMYTKHKLSETVCKQECVQTRISNYCAQNGSSCLSAFYHSF